MKKDQKIEKNSNKRPHILVTNDDGAHAPGLLALAKALRSCGSVSIVAPDKDWSGKGHVKTLDRPIRVNKVELSDGFTAYATDGAPSDCVALAMMGLIEEPIDLVVSGINPMANVGHDVTYSGTVTAIMEAMVFQTRGVAISLNGNGVKPSPINYEYAARIARMIVRDTLHRDLPPEVFLNVNIPLCEPNDLNGIRSTRLGKRVYRDRLDERTDPRGKNYYWIGGDLPSGIPEDDTDIGALAENFVSITPMRLDMTAHSAINNLPEWEWGTKDPDVHPFLPQTLAFLNIDSSIVE